jgi:curli production assembly/transport component CsgG
MKKIIIIFFLLSLSGCTSLFKSNVITFETPIIKNNFSEKNIPVPAQEPITVAVYFFPDKTGQRKSSSMIAHLSSAVTQGAENYLIKALQDIGEGNWFRVIERTNLDNLLKERQIIRQNREIYQGENAEQLPPLLVSGILIEGGIIGYDTNIISGGLGMRIFGIGSQTQYQSDIITISLRAISVLNGEILVSIIATKTVYSYMDKTGVLKFFDTGTNSIDIDFGHSVNESVNRATNMAIYYAVVELIYEGEKRNIWKFKQ